MTKTVRVRMLQTTNGAPAPGTHTYEYEGGKVYDVEPELGRVFLEFGYAEDASDYKPEKDEELPLPGGVEVPETEEEARERIRKAEGGIQPPSDLSIIDPAHHPAQADAIEQAKNESGGAPDAVDVSDPKLTRKQLDEAARQIGLDTTKLPNKDEVRKAIAAEQQ